ncbi:MAG: excinuclease ABC subunit UvrC [Holosporales bacterium]|jgi:excinuclease ABC subunit C|nr:excinuclease ABC subunit UvrC [Holosporales bacterium]
MFTTQTFHFDGYSAFQREIHAFPTQPGVYRMLSNSKEILYIGKAKNVRRRLQSYAKFDTLAPRIQRLVRGIVEVVVTTTQTETEALLLEASLIREHKPRFNVIFKDDRSFPSLLLSKHAFPRLMKYRGIPPQGVAFGPFLSSHVVDMMIEEIAKAFRIRTCTDAVFANRRRPCLRFDIKRCSGPCVRRISQETYQEHVQAVMDILGGKSYALQKTLEAHMQQAATELRYEAAAGYRDQIQAIATLLTRQEIYRAGFNDLDIVVLVFNVDGKAVGLFVVMYRQDCFKGERFYCFDKQEAHLSEDELLPLFIHLYKASPPPKRVLVGALPMVTLHSLQQALSAVAGYPVAVSCPQRGEKARAVAQSQERAQKAIAEQTATDLFAPEMFEQLARVFALPQVPESIEVYDNSHLRGQFPYGVKIVTTMQGFQPKRYRRFPIVASPAQDDCAMLAETLKRRFLKVETDSPPDLLLIDGGKGQLSAAVCALKPFPCASSIAVIAIAKGPHRNAGKERFFFGNHCELMGDQLEASLLFFLQRLRDEAHRFAIAAHRRARTDNLRSSLLDQIPGVGTRRRKVLLSHFGSLKALQAASVSDLAHIPGIGAHQAETIWTCLHNA